MLFCVLASGLVLKVSRNLKRVKENDSSTMDPEFVELVRYFLSLGEGIEIPVNRIHEVLNSMENQLQRMEELLNQCSAKECSLDKRDTCRKSTKFQVFYL